MRNSFYSESRPLRTRCIKKLRLNFLASLSTAAKKLRLSQAQAKKLVKKLRLAAFSPVSPEPWDVLQIESLFPIRTYRKYGLGDHKNCGACTLTREEF